MTSQHTLKIMGCSKTFEKRFWKHVKKTASCWVWAACKDSLGYGLIGKKGAGNQIKASRASWMIHFGKIPDGQYVLHHCDNPPCVRPNHLFLGSNQDNQNDMFSKGRQKVLGAAIISSKAAKEIRVKNANFRKALSKKYGIDVTQICRIINRRRWNHSFVS